MFGWNEYYKCPNAESGEIMYNAILYPTDGSEGANAALDHVQDLASTYDSEVHVLYAIDTTHEGFGMVGERSGDDGPGMSGEHHELDSPGMVGGHFDPDKQHESFKEYGEQVVAETEQQFEGIETVTAVESGDPYETILGYADEHGIDLIVMGTHGRTGADRYLIGSVTEKVVRTSDVPVFTVRGE